MRLATFSSTRLRRDCGQFSIMNHHHSAPFSLQLLFIFLLWNSAATRTALASTNEQSTDFWITKWQNDIIDLYNEYVKQFHSSVGINADTDSAIKVGGGGARTTIRSATKKICLFRTKYNLDLYRTKPHPNKFYIRQNVGITSI